MTETTERPTCTCPPGQPPDSYVASCKYHAALAERIRTQFSYHPSWPDGAAPPLQPAPQLTLGDVHDILDRRQYRPGWVFDAYVGDTTRQVILKISAVVEDSYHPGQQTSLDVRSVVPSFALESELAFDKWLAWRLQAVEQHESQEWYRRPSKKGTGRMVPVFNPHADGADRDQWPIVKRGG